MSVITRRRRLSEGWYPTTGEETLEVLQGWCCRDLERPRSRSVVVPHAGWSYSGRLAFDTLRTLAESDVVVVIGGHLPADSPVVMATEDFFETPLGNLESDHALKLYLSECFATVPDNAEENSVEVLLPMIKHLHPRTRVVWLRVGPKQSLVQELIHTLTHASVHLDYDLTVVGSSDLTHYGPTFGFTDHGTGEAAHLWVRESNDARILEHLARIDPAGVLEAAHRDHSACSAGAAATAAGFARSAGCNDAELIGYHTSYDCRPSDSFVGYAGVTYRHL